MSTPASLTPQPASRVMVSSTFTDLIEHRDACLLLTGHFILAMITR
jgi:hypothetical protein